MKPLALLLPIVLLAACGGASGPGKSAYLAQAEAICKKANSDVKALAVPSTPSALPAYVSTLLGIADAATTQLEKLAPPAADKAQLDKRFLTPLRGQIVEGRAYLGEIKKAVAANDQAALQKLVTNPPTASKADTAWMTSYGFVSCVEAAKTG